MSLGSLKSKKLIIAILAAVGMIVNDALGKPIGEETIYSALGILGTYVLSQGIADHGAQGAATAAKRAIKNGAEVAKVVHGVLGHSPDDSEAPEEDEDGPSWDDTSEEEDEGDGPRELNG